MSNTDTRFDEDIASSFFHECLTLSDTDEMEVHQSENEDNVSGQSKYFDATTEVSSIEDNLSYQISANGAEDDSSWSDYEVDSDFEPGFCGENIQFNICKEALILEQVEELSRKFGEESVSFCAPSERIKLLFGQEVIGVIYLCFPTAGGALEAKRNLSGVWGFDPSQPIIVRLRAMIHLFSDSPPLPLKAGDFCVSVYQGNEPPDISTIHIESPDEETSNDSTDNKTQQGEEKEPSKKDDSSDSNDNYEDDEPNENSVGSPKRKDETNKENKTESDANVEAAAEKESLSPAFRLAAQIQRITEEFLLANTQGSVRNENILTMPLASSSIHMPHQNFQNQCSCCTFINQRQSKKCEMCEQDLMEFHTTNANSNSNLPSARDREEMLQTFLDEARNGGNGILARLYAYLNARIPQLHRFCVNCDSPHLDFCGGLNEPIKPSVCRRDLCSWAFTELGVGRASTDELASTAEVVDLLLAITTAAARSSRASKILNPFPLLVQNNGKRVLDPDKPDYEKAKKIVSKLPSMQQIVATKDAKDLENICIERGEHVYDVFGWITASCTAHLISLSGDHCLASMGTNYQFLMHSASPEQEQAFAAAKKEHGSIFGFHGSPIENWHAILRGGVKNCSGTNLQLHGASYGSGVYISPDASMSLGYSNVRKGSNNHRATPTSESGNKFISGEQVNILALCEIINHNDIRKSGSVWVVPNEKHVVTRFLFVFLPLSSDFNEIYDKASGCNTTDIAFQREILSAMDNVKGNY